VPESKPDLQILFLQLYLIERLSSNIEAKKLIIQYLLGGGRDLPGNREKAVIFSPLRRSLLMQAERLRGEIREKERWGMDETHALAWG
jgi:hypothetical protein